MLVLPALAYLAYRSYERSDDAARLVVKWIVSVPLVLILLALIRIPSPYVALLSVIPAVILGVMWAPTIGAILAGPLTGAFDGGEGGG